MKKQETFTDIEYSFRKKKTKREEFLEIMDEIIPWDEWVGVIEPYYPKGKRGRPPMGIEKMLRMYLLQIWFNLSTNAQRSDIQPPFRSLAFSTCHLTSPSFCFDSAKIKYFTIVPILGHILRLCQRCIPTGQRSAAEEREMV